MGVRVVDDGRTPSRKPLVSIFILKADEVLQLSGFHLVNSFVEYPDDSVPHGPCIASEKTVSDSAAVCADIS